MNIDSLKLSRLMFYTEHSPREKLEDMYFICFNEYPLDNLTTEDLQYNIVHFLKSATMEEIAKVFRYVF